MQQLLIEFNQSKINKIASSYAQQAITTSNLHGYEMDINWIKLAVMHLDHLRQNKYQRQRMLGLAKIIVPQHTQNTEQLLQGNWERMQYSLFVQLINCFEPSMQMRAIQKQHEKPEKKQATPHQHPIVLQDDDHFLLMRAESAAAAIEAKEQIEKITKKQYTWCISSRSNNMFMRYRISNVAPATAYFVLDKTKSVDDNMHAFVLHASDSSILLSNAANTDPKTINAKDASTIAHNLDVSKIIVQPLLDIEKQSTKQSLPFVMTSYDAKTLAVQSRTKLSDVQYALLDKKQQHLYVHYLNAEATDDLSQSAANVEDILNPLTLPIKINLLSTSYLITKFASLEEFLMGRAPPQIFLSKTWDEETKDYYITMVRRTINNAAKLITSLYF